MEIIFMLVMFVLATIRTLVRLTNKDNWNFANLTLAGLTVWALVILLKLTLNLSV